MNVCAPVRLIREVRIMSHVRVVSVSQMSSLTSRAPPSTVQMRRESYLDQKTSDTTALTNQRPASPSVRHSADSGFEDYPIIDQSYTAGSGVSLLRRK